MPWDRFQREVTLLICCPRGYTSLVPRPRTRIGGVLRKKRETHSSARVYTMHNFCFGSLRLLQEPLTKLATCIASAGDIIKLD